MSFQTASMIEAKDIISLLPLFYNHMQ